jgi:exopolysaccharide biosynthesis polyprenyl glycosylphosphotransferase
VRKRDTQDVLASLAAIAADAAAVFGAFLLATWVRFDSGWIAIRHLPPPRYYVIYAKGAAIATIGFLFVLQAVGLFVRPQTGSFVNKIPRLIRACLIGMLLTVGLAFGVQNEYEFSRLVLAIAAVCGTVLLLLERYILFRIEWNVARHSREANRVVVVGTGPVAAHLLRTLRREPMLRSRVVAFLRAGDVPPDPGVPSELIAGELADLAQCLQSTAADQLIVAAPGLGTDQILEILLLCERNLVTFNMVPDLFRLMTITMDVQTLDDIPMLGLGRWPLDSFWNRVLKRAEDIVGALVGLLLAAPIIVVAALLIKRSSPGPVFYRQTRCGEKGRAFTLYKLRTMVADAEQTTGPVFASRDDARTTGVGAFLRRHNLDELPQFWNVLRGEMSLVGPRPERPHFVEQFKNDVARYMWRHVSKPGMTGWAQVNGLRGDTSIPERIRYDLYYLEKWSLSFDFKILVKSLPARENAY